MIKIAAIVTASVVTLIVAITYAVAKSASQREENVQASIYKLRSLYFYFLLLVIAGMLFVTLKSDGVPYPETKKGEPDLVVNVTARTWSWEISNDNIPAGKDIEFAVHTEDVNHGFAVFSPEGKLVAQVQVMPGYTNRLRHKFTEPGEYKVLCLEYCGVSHHKMMTSFNVTSEEGGSHD